MESEMRYRSLGRSGVRVSPICIGTLNFGSVTPESEAKRIVDLALDYGVNFFDTADSYNKGESERLLGRALDEPGRRQRAIVATKVFFSTGQDPNEGGLSRRHIIHSCEQSLRRLGTDWIDLYQAHRPDPLTPIEETLEAFNLLIRDGKVRYIGSTTHPAWKILQAILLAERRNLASYITEQPPYNLLDRRVENEVVPLALEYGVGLIPWVPLAQGVLAGRYASDATLPVDSRAVRQGGAYAERVTADGIAAGERFAVLARARGLSPGQFAFLWVKEQPAVVAPILGVRTAEQLTEMLPILDETLGEEDRRACDQINPPGSVVTNFYNTAQWMKMQLSH